MKGKLVILEGSDSSGKQTQAQMLFERLKVEGYPVKKVEFPNYESQSSALVKMYLNGEFGTDPNAVNPYAASTFYAVDRFASFKKEWEEDYNNGFLIIADRYVQSNMIHQASKIRDRAELNNYLNWLWDLEFVKMGLPIPDRIFFLDMPPEYAQKLMSDRPNKFGAEKKDIHEQNKSFLEDSYQNALNLVETYNWHKVSCIKDETIRSIKDIHEDIYVTVRKFLKV